MRGRSAASQPDDFNYRASVCLCFLTQTHGAALCLLHGFDLPRVVVIVGGPGQIL